MSNTSQAIYEHLSGDAFLPLRAQVRASNLEFAQRRLRIYLRDLLACNPTDPRGERPHFTCSPSWLVWPEIPTSDTYNPNHRLILLIQAAHDGKIVLNQENIQKDSDREWTDTKHFYAERVGEKIVALLDVDDISLKYNLQLEEHLVGEITASTAHRSLVLGTSLKINYRYGENSANGSITVYRQVPTTILGSVGFDAIAKWAEIGKAAAAKSRDRKSRLVALSETVDLLERRKSRVDDLHGTIDYVAKNHNGVAINGLLTSIENGVTELQLDRVPTLAESKLAVKEIRQAVKDAKEALRQARAQKE